MIKTNIFNLVFVAISVQCVKLSEKVSGDEYFIDTNIKIVFHKKSVLVN